jgi:pimeloyl-ACP methyl ester carboxylesterase
VPTSVGRIHLWSAEGGGSLPPVLVVHGLGSAALYWIPMLEHLRPRTRGVMAIDLPGHGFSDRPLALTSDTLLAGVLEALEQADHAPSLVIGHSLGGAAALRYVNAFPARARGLLLFSPAGAPLDHQELAAVKALFRVDSYQDAVRFLRTLHARPAELRARLAAPFVRATLRDPTLRAWIDAIPAFEDDVGRAYLSPSEIEGLPVPARVVWGRMDRVLPGSAREYWRSHLPPRGTLIEPDHVGHTPFLDDRRWTARQVLSFDAEL